MYLETHADQFQNDQMDKTVTIITPDSDKPVPAEFWICHHCETACFVELANT